MAPKIPDRWLDYKAVGKRIDGTRFVAFKVPLRSNFSEKEEDIRFDGKMLLEQIPNLGIIIDLTNTNRYYDPRFFEDEGVEHQKLMIPGHVTPPQKLINRFKDYVKRFLRKNPDNDKLIGVHCTHGVNRTGFLICNYMVSEMAVEPNEAIDKFANARGHKIERNNYLDALQKLTASDGESQEKSTREDHSPENDWRRRDSDRDRDFRHENRTNHWRRDDRYDRRRSPPPDDLKRNHYSWKRRAYDDDDDKNRGQALPKRNRNYINSDDRRSSYNYNQQCSRSRQGVEFEQMEFGGRGRTTNGSSYTNRNSDHSPNRSQPYGNSYRQTDNNRSSYNRRDDNRYSRDNRTSWRSSSPPSTSSQRSYGKSSYRNRH
ncbi:uncharacterized protein LOC142239156 [Haematobia irritans]|uniref:uncharacterized protein LOC142239156 n=1 Tax=Haematobia irritans TaxID=7368 RepID=UPI003F4F4D7A